MSDAIIETQTSGVMRATKAAYRELIKLSPARPAMAIIYLPCLLARSHCRSPTTSKASKESQHLDNSLRSFAAPQQYIHTHMYNTPFSRVISQSELAFPTSQSLASSPNLEAKNDMNNITTTTTTHSPLPTMATMSPPGTTTRPTPPSQVAPTSSAASKSWYSAPSAPAPTMIGPSRPKRMPAGRHVMIGGPSSPSSTLSPAASAGHAPEQSQQRLNNQHMSMRPMNQSMNAMSSSAQATNGSSYGNPNGPARTEKLDMPRA